MLYFVSEGFKKKKNSVCTFCEVSLWACCWLAGSALVSYFVNTTPVMTKKCFWVWVKHKSMCVCVCVCVQLQQGPPPPPLHLVCDDVSVMWSFKICQWVNVMWFVCCFFEKLIFVLTCVHFISVYPCMFFFLSFFSPCVSFVLSVRVLVLKVFCEKRIIFFSFK